MHSSQLPDFTMLGRSSISPQPEFSNQATNAPHLSGSYSPGDSGIRHVTAPRPPLHGFPGSEHALGGHPIGRVADPSMADLPVLPGWQPGIGYGTPPPGGGGGGGPPPVFRPDLQPYHVRRRKRKALIIGVNYASHQNPNFRLSRCIEDAHSMANFLCSHLGFEHRDVRIMTDSSDTTPRDRPTKANILAAMRALVNDAQPDDSFFFYFSGHSTQIRNLSGDESDGLDECICAIDYIGDERWSDENTAGVIVDGRMHELLVQPLPRECRLTAIFDCCHSGNILDLPYLYSSQGIVKEFTHPYRLTVLHQELNYADAISIGASKDHQLAREANGKGALRSAFVQCMNAYNNNVTYRELIQSLRNYMKACGFPQRPLLSSSHEIDTELPFIV